MDCKYEVNPGGEGRPNDPLCQEWPQSMRLRKAPLCATTTPWRIDLGNLLQPTPDNLREGPLSLGRNRLGPPKKLIRDLHLRLNQDGKL